MQNDFPDDTFLARWLNNELTEAELKALRRRDDYETLQRIVTYSEALEKPPYAGDVVWQKLREQRQRQLKPKVKRLNTWVILAAAASVAILLGVYFLFPTTLETYKTGTGEQLTLQLPDGSEVVLNAESTLDYDAANWGVVRRVKLRGEAFFEVARGAVFTVVTGPGEVTVLGTSFNVYARSETMEVLCYSGQVGVRNEAGADTLAPGQKAVVLPATAPVLSTFDLTGSPSWTRAWIDFKEGAPLRRVFAELERQYGKTVIFGGASARVYSGGFPTGDLPAALKFICDPMGLTYRMEADKIYIRE